MSRRDRGSATSSSPSGEQRLERERVEAALGGDGGAFRSLVEPHLSMLFRIARRMCAHDELAEDAVQESLVVAYQRLERYQPGTSFKAFLAAIAARRAHTLVRAERRRQRREQAAQRPGAPATPDEQLAGLALERKLRGALQQLPKKRSAAVLLRLDGDLTHREIAQALGTSEAASRVLVHEGMRQLRELLATDEGRAASATKSSAKGRRGS